MSADAAVIEAAKRLLDSCSILTPPTDFRPLLAARQLKLSFFDEPDDPEMPEDIKKSIRALIDVPDKHIFVSNELHKKKQRFASFHELAHDVLPWHRAIFSHRCSELDLSPRARRQFDQEANAFAAECLFQGSSFVDTALESQFRMSSVLNLADTYHISYESALRRFVEFHPDSCALLVCSPRSKVLRLVAPQLEISYMIRSKTFPWARYEVGLDLPRDNVVSQACRQSQDRPVRENVILVGPETDGFKCHAHILFNGYKAFVLLRQRTFRGSGFELRIGR